MNLKNNRTHFYARKIYMYRSPGVCGFNWYYIPETFKFGLNFLSLWHLEPWNLTFYHDLLHFCIDITIVNDNFPRKWWCDENKMVKNVWQTDRQTKRQRDRQTDGWTDKGVHRADWSHRKKPQQVADKMVFVNTFKFYWTVCWSPVLIFRKAISLSFHDENYDTFTTHDVVHIAHWKQCTSAT